ncbi:MAG: sulfurtransferase [Granulosicoccus sp.]|nr:sulfurtransferase [Granulosicoccus sp.]
MSHSPIVNLSGYRFVHLHQLAELQISMKQALGEIGMLGSVMLASEGINVALAGTAGQVRRTRSWLEQDTRFAGLWLKESWSPEVPFRRLRIRVRAEIIAFEGQDSERLQAARPPAPAIPPQVLDQWLAEGRDMTLLDARNDYEIVSGTFPGATHLDIKHFRHFKAAVGTAVDRGELDPEKPLVTYCTGGIRCEKAAPWLLEFGFREVYQLEGGLLNYLATRSPGFWQGDCFVFDDRVELTPDLKPTGAGLCDHCQLAVPAGTHCRCQLGRH